MPISPIQPIAPLKPVEPIPLVVLDYAPSLVRREFPAPIAVRVLLLAGVVAAFVPFTWDVSPLNLIVELWGAVVAQRLSASDLLNGSLGVAGAMAVPMLLLACIPQRCSRLLAAITVFCIATGLAAVCGAAYVAVSTLYESAIENPPNIAVVPAFSAYALAVAGGSVATVRTLRRSRNSRQVAWLLLVTSYLPTAGLCLWIYRPSLVSRAELGYWLTLVNVIPALFQTITVCRENSRRR